MAYATDRTHPHVKNTFSLAIGIRRSHARSSSRSSLILSFRLFFYLSLTLTHSLILAVQEKHHFIIQIRLVLNCLKPQTEFKLETVRSSPHDRWLLSPLRGPHEDRLSSDFSSSAAFRRGHSWLRHVPRVPHTYPRSLPLSPSYSSPHEYRICVAPAVVLFLSKYDVKISPAGQTHTRDSSTLSSTVSLLQIRILLAFILRRRLLCQCKAMY